MKNYYIKVFIGFIIMFSFLFSLKAKASLPLAGRLIAIDIGHGGLDPGTISGDVYEKDINLKIAKYLEEELAKLGSGVLLVRDGDYDLSMGVKNHRKKTDFDNRIKLINKSEADMYISIHLNHLPNSSYYGAQVFFDKENKNLAESIQKYINNNLDSKREIKKIPSSTYMYGKLNIPGILIECGFLSNPKEKALLITDSYQKKVAYVIAQALNEYYN